MPSAGVCASKKLKLELFELKGEQGNEQGV